MKNLKAGNAEFKSGLFIIISLLLFIISVLWLRHFAVGPEKSIVAEFKDPGPVETGLPVYYQGVNVGKVTKVGFSKDFKYTYIYLDIYNKELELPANVKAMVKIEGLAGLKYISINYPEHPVDELLASGDIIQGETPLGINDIQKILKDQLENGKLKKIFDDFETAMANANSVTTQIGETSERINSLLVKYDKEIDTIVKNTSGAVTNINLASGSVNKIIESPEMQETLTSINKIAKNTEAGTANIFNDIEQTSLISNTNATMTKAYSILDDVNVTLKNANAAACTFDSVGKNVDNMLNQRFLLFKLMFGKPAGNCNQYGNIGKAP